MTWHKSQECALYVLAKLEHGRLVIAYSTLAPTAKDCWSTAVEGEVLGTGHTKKTLKAQGWRARTVRAEVWIP